MPSRSAKAAPSAPRSGTGEGEGVGKVGSGVVPGERGGVVGGWDFSIGISGRELTDIGPDGADGLVVNMPMRAVTGYNWQAEEQNFKHSPSQYGAIHFHDD